MENKSTPIISILIPSYNRLEYLKECIDSCKNQEGFKKDEIEIIISDDSETDIIKKYITVNFPEIIYHPNKKRLGMIGNWNNLLKLCKGKYFIFLSDDDLFFSNKSLYILYNTLIERKCFSIQGRNLIIDGEGRYKNLNKETGYFKKYGFGNLSRGNIGGFSGILFKFDETLEFDETIGLAADWDFNLNFSKNIGSLSYIDYYSIKYRIHSSNLSKSENSMRESEEKVIKKWRIKKYNIFLFKIKQFIVRILHI